MILRFLQVSGFSRVLKKFCAFFFFSVFIVLMEEQIFGDPYCDILEVPLCTLFLYFLKIVVCLFELF